MGDAALWGLIQGLTEFLPISSSGHLVLVPAALGREGPDLATSAVLHLGTLVAVVAYFRTEVAQILRFHAEGRRLAGLLILGTIPAAVLGLAFGEWLEGVVDDPTRVGLALVLTGVVLLASRRLVVGRRSVEETTALDITGVGLAQALALIPGVSRSGMTIAAALGRRFDPVAGARLSFLLGIPAIAGAGFISIPDLTGGFRTEMLVGVAVAAVSGYVAIAILLRLLARMGLTPFGAYCIVVGSAAMIWL